MTPRVILESPFNPPSASECAPWTRYAVLKQNIIYARLALLDSLNRGEAPFASHLLYPQVYSEDPHFRARGIDAGLAHYDGASRAVFYVDLGWSNGMRKAAAFAATAKTAERWEGRRLFPYLTPGADVRAELERMPFEDWPLVEQLKAEAHP
jgi:hypothetical protein